VNRACHDLQEWRSQEAESLGVVFDGTSQIVSNCPGLSEAQQLEFIEMIDTSDVPPNDIHTFEGDWFILFLNPGPRPGLAKGRRCGSLRMRNRIVIFQLDNDEARTLTRIRLMLVEAARITSHAIRRTWCLVSADQTTQKQRVEKVQDGTFFSRV
jgi:hypothetical protein